MIKLNLTKKDIQSGGWIAPEIYRRDWITLFNKCNRLERENVKLRKSIVVNMTNPPIEIKYQKN
jgi:hypothetical protein